jgi:KRAB domain-containing zinc finger protein
LNWSRSFSGFYIEFTILLVMDENPSFTYIETLVEENNLDLVESGSGSSAICDSCGKTFSNVYTLSAHKKTVHEGIKTFVCNICQAAFATKYKLKRHNAGVHSEERNFHCETCLGAFKTRDMLKKHERSHSQGKGPFECHICSEVFKFKSGFDYHHRIKHAPKAGKPEKVDRPETLEKLETPLPKFECQECNKIFTSKKTHDRHERHHKALDDLKCNEQDCFKVFDTVKDQQRHMKLIHKNFIYNCSYCQKQYKSKANFEIHIASHEQYDEMEDYEYVTEPKEVIIEEVYDKNDVESVVEDMNNDIDESSNDEKEVNIEDLLKNIDSDMVSIVKIETEVLEEQQEPEPDEDPVGEASDNEMPIITMEQPLGYGIEVGEDFLIERDDTMDFYETIIAEDLEPPPLSDDDFDEEDYLKFTLLPEKLFRRPKVSESMSVCDECGSTFKNNSHLKRHIMRKHRKDQYKMECDKCGQKFLLSYDLRRHMTKHSDIRDFKCETCSVKFKTELSLKNHIKVVHNKLGEQTRKFACQHCERSYFHQRHLDYHMRKHTGDLRYRCNLCVPEKTFHYSDAIKWHKIRFHGEMAPFSCSICNKKFLHGKSLKTHEKEHKPVSGSLSVNCPECGKSVSEKRHLKRHMRSHTMKEFHCSCGESFKERHQLTK